jgi:hypothetical protein
MGRDVQLYRLSPEDGWMGLAWRLMCTSFDDGGGGVRSMQAIGSRAYGP